MKLSRQHDENCAAGNKINLTTPYTPDGPTYDCTRIDTLSSGLGDSNTTGFTLDVTINVRTNGSNQVEIDASFISSHASSGNNGGTFTDTSPTTTGGVVGMATGSMDGGAVNYVTSMQVNYQ